MDKANLLTVKEIARYLSVHEMTVYRLLKRNGIPSMRVGGQWRFDLEKIKEWLAGENKVEIKRHKPVKKKSRKALPRHLFKYFWDMDPKAIDLGKNSGFVLERLLEYGDKDAVGWMKKSFDIGEIKDAVKRSPSLSSRSANYWHLVFHIDKEDILCLKKSSAAQQERIWRH